MPSGKGSVFTDFYESVYSAAMEKSFEKDFNEFSKVGNRRGMIEVIMKLPQANKLNIIESYTCKNDVEAQEFFEKANQIKPTRYAKIDFLTKALFAATNSEDGILLKILLLRIKSLYEVDAFSKCIKDCDFMIIRLSSRANNQIEDVTRYVESKIECFLYKLKCLKRLCLWEKAKSCTKDGMTVLNELIKLKTNLGTVTNEEKMELLKPFLELLKGIKNSDKKDRVIHGDSMAIIPRIDGKPNEKLESCSDAVSLKYDNSKGRYAVATRNIKAGSVLIIDEPFSWSTDKEALARNCLHCHASFNLDDNFTVPCHNCQTVRFCSESCRALAWEKYHKYECTIFNLFYAVEGTQRSQLLLAYRTTVIEAMKDAEIQLKLNSKFMEYYAVQDDEMEKLKIRLNDEYSPLDYGTVYSLETNRGHIPPKVNVMHTIHSVFLVKCLIFVLSKINPKIQVRAEDEILTAVGILHHLQAINCNAYEIVENIRDEKSKAWEPRNIGGALYTTVSLVNHGCYPNVIRHTYPNGNVVVRAVRFIPKGAEILDCYGPHFLRETRNERRKYLLEKYHFLCKCVACSHNWQLPLNNAFYKCRSCSDSIEISLACCPKCRAKVDKKRTEKRLKESIERRSDAIDKMYDGDYATALPLLLEHAEITEKILAEPSFEIVKTQQAIIQCLNSIGCISK